MVKVKTERLIPEKFHVLDDFSSRLEELWHYFLDRGWVPACRIVGKLTKSTTRASKIPLEISKPRARLDRRGLAVLIVVIGHNGHFVTFQMSYRWTA